MIAGNHELSFDPHTIEEARDYMRRTGEEENTDKVLIIIMMCVNICVEKSFSNLMLLWCSCLILMM